MSGEAAVAWFLFFVAVAVSVWVGYAAYSTSLVGRRISMMFACVASTIWAIFYILVHFDIAINTLRDLSRVAVIFTLTTFAFQGWAVIKGEPNGKRIDE